MSSWMDGVRPLSMLGLVSLLVACTSPPAQEAMPTAPTAVSAPVAALAASGPPEVQQAPEVQRVSATQKVRLQGIDVSHYQPKVDWDTVKTSTAFVFIKATDSTGVVDPHFSAHWSGAKRVGLPRGAYHFFHPKYDVDQQIANFTRHLKSDPGELPPVLDVEEFKSEYQGFTCEQLAGMLQRFSQGVEKAVGRKPMIYTNHETWRMSFCDHPYFTDHPLWLAEYMSHPSQQPKLPPGWSSWRFWQYSETGKVDGIPVAVDQSFFNGTDQDLRALLDTSKPGASAISAAQP
jgi:lysozyme